MDEERCVDNCAGKLIRSNHRLMATYVQLMPRMVQRRMEEMESKAAENAKLEAAASVGSESPATLMETPATAPETSQNPLKLNSNEVGLLGPTPPIPAAENILDNGISVTTDLTGVQNTQSPTYTPSKATFSPEDVPASTTSVSQMSTEHRVGPE